VAQLSPKTPFKYIYTQMHTDFLFGTSSHLVMWRFLAWLMIFETNLRIRACLYTAFPFQLELPPYPYNKSRGIQLNILDNINPYTLDSSDIDTYLDTPVVQWKRPARKQANEIDQIEWVLNYWGANQFEFPLMAQAAQRYLAIPRSEVDVERLFNVGRDVLGIRRHSMNAETLGLLILLKDSHRRLRDAELEREAFLSQSSVERISIKISIKWHCEYY
jgi:hypothetical protein